MLLMILLGVVTKLALVSADCDIGPAKFKFTDLTDVSYFATSLNCFEMNMRNKIHYGKSILISSVFIACRVMVLVVPHPSEI
jgi:hypothetical protein